jgi:membrane fusion protein, multidrug efflux system
VTKHPGPFGAEREISAEEAAPNAAELTPASLASDAQVPAAAPAKPRSGIRRVLMVGAGLVVVGAAGWYGYDYWTVGRFHVSTDDAYVQADNVTIAPKVSGYLVDVLVQDNETVKAGRSWPVSTTATTRSRSTKPKRMCSRLKPYRQSAGRG